MWGDNLLIAEALLNGAQHLLQAQTEVGALWQPYRQTLTHTLREHEEFHLLAYLAVVALLCLFKHYEVLVEHLLLREGDAVETLQLSLAGIATPESACYRGEFDSLDDACGNEVRTTTEVGEVALGVGGDGTILEVLVDVLHLILLTLSLELCDGVSLSNLLTHYGFVLTSQFEHLILNLLEVALLNHLAVRELNIIEETILGSRTEAELYARIEFLECLSEEVGRGVPEGMLAFLVLKTIEGDGGILSDRTIEFGCLTVYAARYNTACQCWRNTLCYLESGYTAFVLAYRTIGEGYINHNVLLLLLFCRYSFLFLFPLSFALEILLVVVFEIIVCHEREGGLAGFIS